MLREHGANVTVFYQDIRTISDGAEEMYRTARGKGVLFVKIAEEDRAEVVGAKAAEAVEAYDLLLRSRVRAPADLVVLSTGMVPREPDTTILQSIFKIPRGEDKFLMERHPELGPVETTTDGVFIVGCLQAPKDIADSLSQASAAAAKVARLLARDRVTLEPTVAEVNAELCRGCGQCAEICQFNAPELVQLDSGVYVAKINEAVCKGCGTCAVWCPTGAVVARHFTDLQIHTMLETALQRKRLPLPRRERRRKARPLPRPRRRKRPAARRPPPRRRPRPRPRPPGKPRRKKRGRKRPRRPSRPGSSSSRATGVRTRVMCSGRVHPAFVLRAFELGADGVLVSGCHFGDCHYIFGNERAVEQFEKTKRLLQILGLEDGRLRLEWISAAEGVKFAEVINEFVAQVTALGPSKLAPPDLELPREAEEFADAASLAK
jgi:heterodisulfide reductase subunit A